MKVVATSDFHGALAGVGEKIPECDLLLIAGDVCPVDEDHGVPHQRDWMRKRFFPWLEKLPAKNIVWIGGNHDFVCESPGFNRIAHRETSKHIHYLFDQVVEVEGQTIYGSPWVPNLPSWAFHRTPAEFQLLAETMPKCDILMLHGPPLGILDTVYGRSVGSPFIANAIAYRIQPSQVVFGHIHEGYGLLRTGETTFRNVAFMDDLYEGVNRPHVFEVP